MITGVKYLSPVFDHSGYGEASRNCIKALLTTGVSITLQQLSFDPMDFSNYGEFGSKLNSLVNYNINYSHKILHCTPEYYPKYTEKGVKNVGFVYWESSGIPTEWVGYINKNVDAQIVCCDYSAGVLHECGITKPIYKLLPPFDINNFVNVAPYQLAGIRENTFVFYSIFQWTKRKNPVGLLLAYFTEFCHEEDVVLVLKTYRSNTSGSEQDYIRRVILSVKNDLRLPVYPKIFFIGDLLTNDQILGLHSRGDCCVIPSRCFVSGTEVLTSKGLVSIENINVNDVVLTHEGNYKKVTSVFKNSAINRKLLEFKVSGSYEKFVATNNHQVFAIKLTNRKRFPRGKKLNLSDVCIYKLNDLRKGDILIFPRHLRNNKRNVDKEELALLYGYFLAEGCLARRIRKGKRVNEGIVFSINNTKLELHGNIVRLMKKYYNLEPHVLDKSRNRRCIYYYSRKLCDEFSSLFYSNIIDCNSHTKNTPFYFLDNASVHEIGYLIKGIFEGDGYKCNTHDNKGRIIRFISISSVSKTMLVQCKKLLADIGIGSNLSYRGKTFSKPLNISGDPSYVLWVKGQHLSNLLLLFENSYGLGSIKHSYSSQKVYNSFIALKLREINTCNNNEDFVYGIEVEDDHSYCLSSFVSKNSEGLGMSHAEAMASGNPVIATRLGGHMEFMNDDNSYLVNYMLSPVFGMPWIPWYRGDQVWAEPDIMGVRKHMRYVYENREEAKKKGILARETIREKLDMDRIGKEFIEILNKV